MDAVIEFLQPDDMFLDPNNNTKQDVIMKSKGKKNSLRLQSMINRCKLLSLSDSDEEHKNKEEKTAQSSKCSSNSVLTNKSRTSTTSHVHHIRTRNNRSPYSHKLLSGKRNRSCWSDMDNSRANSNASNSIEMKESSSTNNKDYVTKNSQNKRYSQRINCQQQSQTSAEQSKQSSIISDFTQDFYGDDEASDFFDSSQSSTTSSRVRRVKVRHFRQPCPKYDLNSVSYSKRRKVT